MAVSENDTSDCNSDSSADGMSKERKEKPFTKAIIRRLPPSMTKDIFLEQVSPLPDYDYMYFVKADYSLGEFAFSRAYINFKNSSDIFLFKEKFDNYVFLDHKGNEYTAVVEFAPFSRIPKKRNKVRVDPKCSSIETDPIYLDFVESLKAESIENDAEKPEYCFQPSLDDEKQKVVNTPLLDFIKQRRIDRQKIREEKREERKRKEIERKRYKEEGRRKPRPDTYPTKNPSKNVQILNSTKDSAQDEKKDEKVIKERKYEDKYERKPYKEERKYQTYSKTKEIRKSDDYYKKSPSKIRPRFEKTDIKPKPEPRKREDNYRSNRRNDYSKEEEQEKIIEKKVKKYSERRAESKIEIKKIDPPKNEEKEEEVKKNDEKIIEITPVDSNDKTDNYDDKNDELSDSKENQNESNEAKKQRRIRNKDRPSMAIYQPGMGFRRNRSENNLETKSESQNNS